MSTRPAESAAPVVPEPDADGVIHIDGDKLKKKIIKEGTGQRPTDRAEVKVHYTGRLLDGTEFDSSKKRNEPFTFKLGRGQVIKGWEKGVATMRVGEHAILTCSPEYAYGERGSPPTIPPNATLEFEVELLSFDNTQKVTDDGCVKKSIQQTGEGYNRPNDFATCTIKYTGRVKGSEKPFVDHSSEAVTVHLTQDTSLIWGLEEGVKNMLKGERSILFVSPMYGFGTRGDESLGAPPNFDLEFDVELLNFEKGKESFEMDYEGKRDRMKTLKDCGNAHFKLGIALDRAIKVYQKAINMFQYEDSLEDAQKNDIHALKVACISNVAVCKLKQGLIEEVVHQATAGLNIQPRHVKLLYLRGLAHNRQNQLVEAERDLKLAHEIDSKNVEVLRELRTLQSKQRAIKDKEKNLFGGFFNKVRLVSEEEEKRMAEETTKKKSMDFSSDEESEHDSEADDEEKEKDAKMEDVSATNDMNGGEPVAAESKPVPPVEPTPVEPSAS